MGSTKKIEASYRNGRRSSRPKTSAGKKTASRNAQKHGLLADELTISNDDRPAFDGLRASLEIDLRPRPGLLTLLFEDIVVSAWKLKLALRWEQAELENKLGEIRAEDSHEEGNLRSRADQAPRYNYFDIRGRLRLLEELEDACKFGHVAEDWREPLSQAFGPAFYEILAEWKPTDSTLIPMLEVHIGKGRLYGMGGLPSEEEQREALLRQKKLEDPLRLQMLAKLIALEKERWGFYLLVHGRESDGNTAGKQSERLDLAIRYRTTITRDFYRAVNEFLRLKKEVNPPPIVNA